MASLGGTDAAFLLLLTKSSDRQLAEQAEAAHAALLLKWNPGQPRGKDGRWTRIGTEVEHAVRDIDRDPHGPKRREPRPRVVALTDEDARRAVEVGPHLTPTQHRAVDRYQGDASYNINRLLRAGEPLTPRYEQTVSDLDSVMAETRMPSDAVLHRLVERSRGPFGDADEHPDLTGFEWTDRAYVSTSAPERKPTYRAVSMQIRVPRGTPAISSYLLDNDEVLLGRGQKFRVVADHGTSGGIRRLDVEIVPTDGRPPKKRKR